MLIFIIDMNDLIIDFIIMYISIRSYNINLYIIPITKY